ncbi:ferredoxin [Microbacterium mangrovi]|jgi:NAD-dependent dihydropyrimidine dehydrogenase PreA subunit|uniref:Ferredoxin n=1 Tax=Microbacterium mangrovi TaxID=1348253 RepID=A0A0B2A8I7_9MICO|nr:ferredoxin [Microbacterium mangrovi]KHK97832.1 ferredoxin [Microbacterium mangrovi]
MAFVVTQACVDVKDRSCIQVCPADCLFEGERMMYINQDLCIDCGACEAACPTQAIHYDGDLDGEDEKFIAVNEQFFEGIDVSAGGRKMGNLGHDATFVAELPAA